jgi:RNA recognition motif-containing protein
MTPLMTKFYTRRLFLLVRLNQLRYPWILLHVSILLTILERHKGFGFVEYEEYEDCLHAIENMNDAELCGRVLRVSFARPQRFKEGTGKPIWMEENYHKNKSIIDEDSSKLNKGNDKKQLL